MPDLQILRSSAELESLVPEWRRLWAEDPMATPFQSPEWLLPWWHQFGQPTLRAITIIENGELIAFLPFYIYEEPRSGQRQLLLVGVGTTDYLDGLFSPASTVEDVTRALRLLLQETDWDILSVTQLRRESKLYRAFARLGARAFECDTGSQMPALSLGELPVKIRRNAMYYRNRAARAGKLALTLADESDCQQTFEALERLHTERWQSSGEPGVLADPRVLAWHREAIPLLQRRGFLRLCSLRLSDEIIGVLYSIVNPAGRLSRTQYFYLTAYAVKHAELRPGTLLLALAIEQAKQEGIELIDMLRGNESYKQIWHLERVATYGFTLFAGGKEMYSGVMQSAECART